MLRGNITCNVQNDKLEIVLKNRVNTLSLLGQVEGLTAIKTDEELISIICQTFNDFGICIAHIDRGEYIAYSIGTYISQITYYITLKNDIGEWLSSSILALKHTIMMKVLDKFKNNL